MQQEDLDQESHFGSEFGAAAGGKVVLASSDGSRFATVRGRSGGGSGRLSDAAGGRRRSSLLAAALQPPSGRLPWPPPPTARSSMVSDAHNYELAGRRYSVLSVSDAWGDALSFGPCYPGLGHAPAGGGRALGPTAGAPGFMIAARRRSLVLDEDLAVGGGGCGGSRRSSVASNTGQQSHRLPRAAPRSGDAHVWVGGDPAGARRENASSSADSASCRLSSAGSAAGGGAAARPSAPPAAPLQQAAAGREVGCLEWPLGQSAAWGGGREQGEVGEAVGEAGRRLGPVRGAGLANAQQQQHVELLLGEAAGGGLVHLGETWAAGSGGLPLMMATKSNLLEVGRWPG
jgi:hypothetical protein